MKLLNQNCDIRWSKRGTSYEYLLIKNIYQFLSIVALIAQRCQPDVILVLSKLVHSLIRCSACIDREDTYETKAYHHWCLVTVIVEEDQINTLVSSPRAFI